MRLVQGGREKELLELSHEIQFLGDDVVEVDKIIVASLFSAYAQLDATL